MNELIKLNPIDIKGYCKIELYDAETKELLESQEGPNFVSPAVLNVLFKQMQKIIVAGGNYNSGLSVPYNMALNPYYWDGMFRYLVLTDSTMAESPSTEISCPGNVIGWANRTAYAGSSSVEGSINVSESYADETKTHWVFDFPTNAANGNINSVCWVFTYPEIPAQTITGKLCGTNITFYAKFKRTYSNGVGYGDGYFWGVAAGYIYKIDPVTFAEISVSTAAITFSPQNRTLFSNGFAYLQGYSSWCVAKVNVTTGAVVAYTSTIVSLYPIMVDSTYLYSAVNNSNQVYRHKVADMTLMDQKSIVYAGNSMGTIQGSFFIGSQIYLIFNSVNYAGQYPGIYSYDYASNTLTLVWAMSTSGYIEPLMFSDGTNMYVPYTETFYPSQQGGSTSATQIGIIPGGFTNLVRYNLMARKLLGATVTKTTAKTMKIIYEFTFS